MGGLACCARREFDFCMPQGGATLLTFRFAGTTWQEFQPRGRLNHHPFAERLDKRVRMLWRCQAGRAAGQRDGCTTGLCCSYGRFCGSVGYSRRRFGWRPQPLWVHLSVGLRGPWRPGRRGQGPGRWVLAARESFSARLAGGRLPVRRGFPSRQRDWASDHCAAGWHPCRGYSGRFARTGVWVVLLRQRAGRVLLKHDAWLRRHDPASGVRLRARAVGGGLRRGPGGRPRNLLQRGEGRG